MTHCAVCHVAVPEHVAPAVLPEAVDPPDFDTRPGEPLRSTIGEWVIRCPNCGYCCDDLSRSIEGAAEVVGSAAYSETLSDASLPAAARHFLCYALLLERLHQFADAGWSSLHAAWVCDDAGNVEAAARCRSRVIELWKRGKHVGQLFADDMATEFALVTDVHRRMGEFEHATVACAEGLDLEDILPPVEAMLRRQLVLIQRRDTSRHSMLELLHAVE